MDANVIAYDRVAIVGEYTLPIGPYSEDHFLALVYYSDEVITIPSEKAGKIVQNLEQRFETKLDYHLCNVTKAASRIIFPPTLAGNALFSFVFPKLGIIGMIKVIKDFGRVEIKMPLTDEAKNYIHNRRV